MSNQQRIEEKSKSLSWLFIGVVGTLIAVAFFILNTITNEPLYLAIGVLFIFAVVAFLKWPDLATLFVIALLYSNAAVVATRFHGMPSMFQYLFPLTLVIPFFWYIFILRRKIVVNSVLFGIIFLTLVQFAGVITSRDSTETFVNVVSAVAEGYLLYFLLTNVIRDKKTMIRAIWVILIVGLLLGGLSLYQQLTNSFNTDFGGFAQTGGAGFATGDQNLQGNVEQARLSGPIGEKNRYAQIMLMLVPIGLFYSWGAKSTWLKWLALLAGVVSMIGAALAFSRGAAIAFVLVVLVMGLAGFVNARQFVIIIGITLLLGIAFPQYTVRIASIESVITSVIGGDQNLSGADSSTLGRLTEMLAARDVWMDHPLVGVGTGMFRYYFQEYQKDIGFKSVNETRQAHNLYLGIAADNGTLGLIAYMFIFGVVLWELLKVRKLWLTTQPDLAALASGLFLAIVVYLSTGFFLQLSYIRFPWLILALSMALVNLYDPDSSTKVPQVAAGELAE